MVPELPAKSRCWPVSAPHFTLPMSVQRRDYSEVACCRAVPTTEERLSRVTLLAPDRLDLRSVAPSRAFFFFGGDEPIVGFATFAHGAFSKFSSLATGILFTGGKHR